MSDGSCGVQESLVAEKRRAFGEDHPETLAAMLDLADCLWAQGRLIAARKLEEHVIEGRRRLLGEQHPDTLKAVGKLAVTLGAQGNLERGAPAAGASRQRSRARCSATPILEAVARRQQSRRNGRVARRFRGGAGAARIGARDRLPRMRRAASRRVLRQWAISRRFSGRKAIEPGSLRSASSRSSKCGAVARAKTIRRRAAAAVLEMMERDARY